MLVKERMSKHPILIGPDVSISEALNLMKKEKVRRLPVVDPQGHLVGIVSDKDLLHASPSPATSLSGGEQQMCAVGRGLMARPKMLLVDELSLGLAPIVVEAIYEAVAQVRARGMTVLIVEQDVQIALEQADRGYVLDVGHLIMSGTSADLMANPKIKEAYLGI